MNFKKPLIFFVGLLLVSATIVVGTNLPSTTVSLKAVDGIDSYFNITLSGVPAGFDVHNGLYPGWCAGQNVTMPRNTHLFVTLYDTFDPELPVQFQDNDWDKVNWILNNKGDTSMLDIQDAIWHFIDEYPPFNNLSTEAKALVSSAVDGYTPGPGNIIAIIAVPLRADAQCTFIELVIPGQHVGGRWTGGGTIDSHTPRVTHGFELHCNMSQLPNNLEVNWGGHHFHMDVLENVSVCWNDPAIDPEHPRARCDTIEGWGHGKLDGVSECHVYFKFTDEGEPGSHDFAHIKITDQNDAFVMEVSGDLKSGNQQAHRLTGIDAR